MLGPADLDPLSFRLRMAGVRNGLAVEAVVSLAVLGYALATWERPHRAVLVALALAGLTSALAVRLAPLEDLMRGRAREPLFLVSSILAVGLVATAAALDGGAHSPLAFALFLTLVFAALSYPLPSVVVVGASQLIALIGIEVAAPEASAPFLAFFAVCLAGAAIMGAALARNQEEQRAELARLSRTDPLTDCLNRRGFEERVDESLGRAERSGEPLGLVILDFDAFKRVNDTRGHAAGDALLRAAVAVLDAQLRPSDAIGRLGGDEFAVLVAGGRPLDTAEVVARARRALAPLARASFGVAHHPQDGTTREELLSRADADLYAAKATPSETLG